MARQLRLEYAGAIYRVMSWGGRQEAISLDDEDRRQFYENAQEGRSAENGIGGGNSKTDVDDDGVDCQRIQRRRAK